jgi:hypothetical protein
MIALFVLPLILAFAPAAVWALRVSGLLGILAAYVRRHMPSGPEKLTKIRRMGDVDGPLRC